MKTLIAFALIAFTLLGCATTPPLSEQMAADYGPEPSDYQHQVKAHFENTLIDPESARFRWKSDLQKGFLRKPPILGGGIEAWGYLVTVGVNAKNRLGGYVGEKDYQVFFKNGQVYRVTQLTY